MPSQEQIDALVAAPELPEVSVLRVQPGDTIVLRFRDRLTDYQFEHVLASAQGKFPDNQVMVLELGVGVLVLRKDGA